LGVRSCGCLAGRPAALRAARRFACWSCMRFVAAREAASLSLRKVVTDAFSGEDASRALVRSSTAYGRTLSVGVSGDGGCALQLRLLYDVCCMLCAVCNAYLVAAVQGRNDQPRARVGAIAPEGTAYHILQRMKTPTGELIWQWNGAGLLQQGAIERKACVELARALHQRLAIAWIATLRISGRSLTCCTMPRVAGRSEEPRHSSGAALLS
jgi:hypothetical protein